MIQKKVCLLGAFAVGKTSLVRRFVVSIFSERYLTTVGVKIDRRVVDLEGRLVKLILWDMAGEDDLSPVNTAYLRGASGVLLVADGTRPSTLEVARDLERRTREKLGDVPFVLILNKCDLAGEWALPETRVQELRDEGWTVLRGSAKTGEGVKEAFHSLASRLLGAP